MNLRRKLPLYFALSFSFSFSFAQTQDTLWTRTYGTTNTECGRAVRQTDDGGFIVTGERYMTNSYDIWLLKTDAYGDTQWTRTFGTSGWHDEPRDVILAPDGGYAIVGITDAFGAGENDLWLIKTDSLGEMAWNSTYGGLSYDCGNAIEQTMDSGYVMIGETSSFGVQWRDIYLIKTNAYGDTQWTKTYGGPNFDAGYSIQQTNDGGYIAVGIYGGLGNYDVWALKLDANGDTFWTKTYGVQYGEIGYAVDQTSDNGYIITGYENRNTFPGDENILLIKTDSLGNAEWTRTYDETASERAYSVQQAPDKGYILVGQRAAGAVNLHDVWVIRTDSLGDTLWTRQYGGNMDDIGRSLQITDDGGCIITGMTFSFGAGNYDIWLLKLGPETGAAEKPTDAVACQKIQSTMICGSMRMFEQMGFKIYNVTGREVNAETCSPGIYFVKTDDYRPRKIIKMR